jgi:hypothetical protein
VNWGGLTCDSLARLSPPPRGAGPAASL